MSKDKLKHDELIKIDMRSLDKAFVTQAPSYLRFAKLYEKAETKKREAKNQKELVHANLFLKYKKQKDADLKSTDQVINAQVVSDPEYQESVKEHLQAEHKANILKTVAKAFEQRGQMLITIGANTRVDKKMVYSVKTINKDGD